VLEAARDAKPELANADDEVSGGSLEAVVNGFSCDSSDGFFVVSLEVVFVGSDWSLST